jgi:phage gpG-like protein
MITVDISVTGLNESLTMIDNLKAAVEDVSMEMQDIGDHLMRFYSNDVYDSEGGAFGHQWKPLSPSYALEKMKRWGSNTILVASGEMKNSYALQTSSNSMTISNSAPYFGYHQQGTSRMPQRVLFDVDGERLDYITNTILNGIIGKLGA